MAKSVKEREREFQARQGAKDDSSYTYVPEKLKIDVALEECEKRGIPAEIKNGVLMAKVSSEQGYEDYRKMLSDLMGGEIPFSFGATFVNKDKVFVPQPGENEENRDEEYDL